MSQSCSWALWSPGRLLAALALLALAAFPVSAQETAPKSKPATREAKPTRAPRAFLGVQVRPPQSGSKQKGLVVEDVAPGSPADRAGLQEGDRLTQVNGKPIESFEGLLGSLSKHKPGDKVKFQVSRDGEKKDVTVTLAQRPQRERVAGNPPEAAPAREKPSAYLGVTVVPLTEELQKRFDLEADHGVLVAAVMPDTPAAKAGLQHGDVIESVNGKKIASPQALRQAISRAGAGKAMKLTVLREGEKKQLQATPEESPVDGIGLIPTPFGRFGRRSLIPALMETTEKVDALEKKVQDLEKRVKALEGKKSESRKSASRDQ